jgi:nanoRNase/pAp phosphatase (c-di-AMP/oligoRNAs hydrolase)
MSVFSCLFWQYGEYCCFILYSPDGDALGSSLGLYHFLCQQGKTVNVIVPNAFPDFLRWMPGAKDIIRYDKYAEFGDKLISEADVICCLDFNALSRIDAQGIPSFLHSSFNDSR